MIMESSISSTPCVGLDAKTGGIDTTSDAWTRVNSSCTGLWLWLWLCLCFEGPFVNFVREGPASSLWCLRFLEEDGERAVGMSSWDVAEGADVTHDKVFHGRVYS